MSERPLPVHYVVGLSIVCEKRGGTWHAVVADMPVKATGTTREEALRAVHRAALLEMAEGRGPAYTIHDEMAAAVAGATIDSMWRFMSGLFKQMLPLPGEEQEIGPPQPASERAE